MPLPPRLHAGRPAFLKLSAQRSKSSALRIGNRFVILERRSPGMSRRKRAIAFPAATWFPRTAALAAATDVEKV